MSVDLPAVNARIEVSARGGPLLPSRVEDADGDVLHIAEPHGVDARGGERVTIHWVTERGMAEVEATVEARITQHAMHVWRIRAAEPQLHQRRRFVRARALLRVDIEWEEGLGLQRIAATSLDISEGGIQVVTLGRDEVPVGRAVQVMLDLDGDEVRLGGDVIQSRMRPDGSRAVVVRFTGVRSGDADRIRKYVFASQLHAARSDG